MPGSAERVQERAAGTAEGLLPQVRCVERLLLISKETASLLKPASGPSAIRILEVSV